MNPKLLSMLGLARRAGKIITGDEACMKSVRSGKARLIIVAADASENTRKKYGDKCAHYNTKLILTGDRVSIGAAIGRPEQVVIAIEDQGFASGIRTCMEKSEV
ncbi:MAG: ribosomal L7Ae/L30e/S12e/Gadd45 family protein [Paenibacillaceae bacterium]